jgi:hypothetical protein
MLFCFNLKHDKSLSNKEDIKSKRQLHISYLYVELDEGHMNAIHVQMMTQQDLIKMFSLL